MSDLGLLNRGASAEALSDAALLRVRASAGLPVAMVVSADGARRIAALSELVERLDRLSDDQDVTLGRCIQALRRMQRFMVVQTAIVLAQAAVIVLLVSRMASA